MKKSILLLASAILILVFSACPSKKCGVEREKRIIINDSGVEVILKAVYNYPQVPNTDTITNFDRTYVIGDKDSLISVDEYTHCGRSSASSTIKGIEGSFGFATGRANYARLIFNNHKIQHHTFKDSISILLRRSYLLYSSNVSLRTYIYIITPEDYEQAKSIDP